MNSKHSKQHFWEEILGKKIEEVNILHLSDLHFGMEKAKKYEQGSYDRDELFEGLIRTLKEDIPKEWRPDIIVISGDIAWCGDEDEYKQYQEKFLDPLLKTLSIPNTPQRVIVCPGNHDIIRTAIAEDIKRPQRGEAIGSDVQEITLESIIQDRYKHFENYINCCCNGVATNICRLVENDNEWPWLHFLVLNSAWDCRDNDDAGRLRVGRNLAKKYYSQIERDRRQSDTIVTVFHHPSCEVEKYDEKAKRNIPVKWLHDTECGDEDEGEATFETFINNVSDLVLNGHVHVERIPRQIDRATNYISGTIYSSDVKEYHCRIIKVRKGLEGTTYINLRRKLSDMETPWECSQEREPREKRYSKSLENWAHRELLIQWSQRKRTKLIRFIIQKAIIENDLREEDVNEFKQISTRNRRKED